MDETIDHDAPPEELDEQDASVQFKSVPLGLQELIDHLVDRAVGRSKRRRGFKRLGAWIASNDWDALVDDSPGGGRIGLAVDLRAPFGTLNDDDLIEYEGRASRRGLTDADRVKYARLRLAEQVEEADDSALSVVVYPIRHSDGMQAYLCGVIHVRGQAGAEVEWFGAFESRDAYLDWLPKQGLVYEDNLDDLSDAELLAAWQRSPSD